MNGDDRLHVGWREWIALPGLGIHAINAKIDTGARTSALHTFTLETFVRKGQRAVRFGIHPLQRRTDIEIFCEADVLEERFVMDSGGHKEKRLVIRTPIQMADASWPVEITLTNREDMRFRMLLGRTALQDRFAIEPDKSYLLGRHLRKYYKRR